MNSNNSSNTPKPKPSPVVSAVTPAVTPTVTQHVESAEKFSVKAEVDPAPEASVNTPQRIITVGTVPKIQPVAYISERTLAEMELGRRVVAKYR